MFTMKNWTEVISHKPGLEYQASGFKTVKAPDVKLNSKTYTRRVIELKTDQNSYQENILWKVSADMGGLL